MINGQAIRGAELRESLMCGERPRPMKAVIVLRLVFECFDSAHARQKNM